MNPYESTIIDEPVARFGAKSIVCVVLSCLVLVGLSYYTPSGRSPDWRVVCLMVASALLLTVTALHDGHKTRAWAPRSILLGWGIPWMFHLAFVLWYFLFRRPRYLARQAARRSSIED